MDLENKFNSLNFLQRLAESALVQHALMALRARFTEYRDFEDGQPSIRRFPRTSLECKNFDVTTRSALHIYGNPRSDTITAEAFAEACIYIERELTALKWVLENPQTAKWIADEKLKGETEY